MADGGGRMRRGRSGALCRVAAAAALLAGCDSLTRVAGDLMDSRTPRQRYVDALGAAGLAGTALARDWTEAGERALRDAPLVTTPHEEIGYLAPGEPAAVALRVRVRRGQEVQLTVELPGDTSTTVFLDAWTADDSGAPPVHLVSADSAERSLRLAPRRDGDVLFRFQPELLRGGRFRVAVRIDPTLAFPVKSGTERDVGSRFGAPRDAGARRHHGIDIFAKRGTPVIAAAPGVVSRSTETNLGGKVVWVRDSHGNSLYYAHLDSQAVESGERVDVGDTVGFVGNTGNARTTPPHLHFGVYRRGEGPVDPWWFVHRPRGTIARLVADTARLGRWVRPTRDRMLVTVSPARADTAQVLPRHAAMRVIAAAGAWYRVRLPDGMIGFVTAQFVETVERPIGTLVVSAPILARPGPASDPADVLHVAASGDSLDVLGRYGTFALVRSSSGVAGWVSHQ